MSYHTPHTIGRAIRKRREALELTQTALSKRAGVSRQWIAAIERGKPRAELRLVLRTLKVLDLDVMIGATGQEHRAIEPPARTWFGRWLAGRA